jgi:hypothetical protein
VSDVPHRAARWEPDDRGVGVGDARAHLGRLDALRLAADEAGWVAEAPESHLLPHLVRHAAETALLVIESASIAPDGTFVVDTRWAGPLDADRRAVRAAAVGLIGAIAEATTFIHEDRGPDGVAYDVVTGMLPGETQFASHGHTLRLRVGPPIEVDGAVEPDAVDTGA